MVKNGTIFLLVALNTCWIHAELFFSVLWKFNDLYNNEDEKKI